MLLALLHGGPVAGQRVTGRVTDRASGRALPSAVVELLGASDRSLLQTLSNEQGEFLLNVADTGRVRLRVQTLGYRTALGERFRMEPGGTRHFDIALDVEPLTLDVIDVRKQRTCAIRSSASDILRVWNAARSALANSAIVSRQRVVMYDGYTFDRVVSDQDVTLHQSLQRFASRLGEPFVSLPAADLLQNGYIRRSGSDYSYYAPSAAVLLSSEFETSHCFSLTRSDHGQLLGVEFTPAGGSRQKAGVSGVAWLDAHTQHLDFIEIRYTDADDVPYADQASGRVEFRMLPNGAWLVSRWLIRVPYAINSVRMGSLVGPPHIKQFAEQGGEVVAAAAAGQRWVLASPGSIAGEAFDSTRNVALAGATVSLEGTAMRATTDGQGRFRINDVPAGLYTLTLGHPRLDSLPAYPAAGVPVRVAADSTTATRVALPPIRRSVLADCPPPADRAQRESRVYGVVRDSASGQRLGGAELHFLWDSFAGIPSSLAVRHRDTAALTDEQGRYHVCSLPTDRNILVRITVDSVTSPPQRFLTADSIMQLDLRFAHGPAERAIVISGRVVDARSAPLASAQVDLIAADSSSGDRVQTDSAGRFRFTVPVSGVYRLTASAPGYQRTLASITVTASTELQPITLQALPVKRDSIRVQIESAVPSRRYAGLLQATMARNGGREEREQRVRTNHQGH